MSGPLTGVRLVEFAGIGPAPFCSMLLADLGADDRGRWPEVRAHPAAIFATRTRDEWAKLCAGRDACLAPVLSLHEAQADPHHVERGVFVDVEGVAYAAPAPRFGSSLPRVPQRPPVPENTPSRY